ncbi:MAG: 50S ribosomal protein L15 [Patescibacteria group bacterium]
MLSKLPKITTRSKKRIGRGIGSGKGGHTVGRGAKGQKARGKIAFLFEGTKIKKSLLKRLPLIRGKGKFKPSSQKPIIVNLKYLNLFSPKEEVTLKTLEDKGILRIEDSKSKNVKILGEGEVKIPLIVKLPCSKGAKAKIEKAGGKIVTARLPTPDGVSLGGQAETQKISASLRPAKRGSASQ